VARLSAPVPQVRGAYRLGAPKLCPNERAMPGNLAPLGVFTQSCSAERVKC
jgi:hypothetical protein